MSMLNKYATKLKFCPDTWAYNREKMHVWIKKYNHNCRHFQWATGCWQF